MGTDKNLQALARELQSDMDARVVRRVFAESRGPATVADAYAMSARLSPDGAYVGFGTQPAPNQATAFYLFDNLELSSP